MATKLEFSIYPENLSAIDLAIAMSTQLRTSGFSGRIVGFDYHVIPFVARRIGVLKSDLDQVFQRLTIIEDELFSTPRYLA